MHDEREWNISFKKYDQNASEHMQNGTQALWEQCVMWYYHTNICIIVALFRLVYTLYSDYLYFNSLVWTKYKQLII